MYYEQRAFPGSNDSNWPTVIYSRSIDFGNLTQILRLSASSLTILAECRKMARFHTVRILREYGIY